MEQWLPRQPLILTPTIPLMWTKVITGLKKNWKVEEAKGFITSIDGRKENQKKSIYWTYTVNGKKVNKLANQQTLKNNDKVQFTLDKAE